MTDTFRAARFAAALAALWAAHDVADHVVQTDDQARRKATDWRAMAGHVGGYHLVQAATIVALRPLGVRPSWWATAAGVAVSAASHAFLDRRWPVERLLRATGSDRFAAGVIDATQIHYAPDGTGRAWTRPQPLPLHGPYLADQAMHHAALAVVAAILAGGA